MSERVQRSVGRQIVRIAFPAIVSNITVPLLGICDTAVTGHLGKPAYVAAIAVGAMMLNVLLWSFGFLRMGTTGLTAQAWGSGSREQCRVIFTRSLLLAFLIGVVLIAFQRPLESLLSLVIGSEAQVSSLAVSYFRVCVWGIPGILGSMAISGWFLGMQNSTRPMWIAILTNVVNIFGSILLAYPLGLGFIGTAYGTLIANCFSLLLALVLVWFFCDGSLPLAKWNKAVNLNGLGRFFRVNGDIFVRSFFIMAVSMGVTSIGARLGAMTLAVNAVIMQMFFLFSYFMDGFAFSAEALSGKAMGGRDWNGLGIVVRKLLLYSLWVCIGFSVIYLLGYRVFASLLVPQETVLMTVDGMRVWIWLLPLSSVLAFIYDGFYIGLTATRAMLIVTATASLLFFAAYFSLTSARLVEPEHALWLAFEAYLFLRGILLALYFPNIVRPLRGKMG